MLLLSNSWTRPAGLDFGEPLVPYVWCSRVFGAAFLPGPASLALFFLLWAVPGGGSSGFRSLEIA